MTACQAGVGTSTQSPLRIEVHDACGDRPVPRQVGELDESGRGLLLVQALSQRWGCCPRAGGVGKVTWCEYVPEIEGGQLAGKSKV